MGNVTNKTSASAVGVDDFEFLFLVGKGAFGKVWKVRKKDTGKIYAMKILRKKEVLEQNLVEHTNLERDIMAVFGSHPFIINLYFAFQTADKLHFVLDYLSGGSLFYHLSNHDGPFPEHVVAFYAAEIIVGLETLHKNNIVYRDLKLENILLDTDGHIRLTDFGLSAKLEQNRLIHSFSGTALYLAPEILMDRGEGHGKSVDWWSLGVLIHVMLTQEPPFWSENNRALFDMIMRQDVNLENKILSREAISLLRGLLVKDWRRRLGCGIAGPDEIKAHPFFRHIDWNKLLKKKITPPLRPQPDQEVQEIEFDGVAAVHDESIPNVGGVRKDPILKKHRAAFADFSFISDRPPPNMPKVQLNLPADSSLGEANRIAAGVEAQPQQLNPSRYATPVEPIESPAHQRKPFWIPDKDATDCTICHLPFTTLRRRHHCRQCGKIFCNTCSSKRIKLVELGYPNPVRVCDLCFHTRHPDLPVISEEERQRLLEKERSAEEAKQNNVPTITTSTSNTTTTTTATATATATAIPVNVVSSIPTKEPGGEEKRQTNLPVAFSDLDEDSNSPDLAPLPLYRSPILVNNFLTEEGFPKKQNSSSGRPTSLPPVNKPSDPDTNGKSRANRSTVHGSEELISATIAAVLSPPDTPLAGAASPTRIVSSGQSSGVASPTPESDDDEYPLSDDSSAGGSAIGARGKRQRSPLIGRRRTVKEPIEPSSISSPPSEPEDEGRALAQAAQAAALASAAERLKLVSLSSPISPVNPNTSPRDEDPSSTLQPEAETPTQS